jgi:hypothetical protein
LEGLIERQVLPAFGDQAVPDKKHPGLCERYLSRRSLETTVRDERHYHAVARVGDVLDLEADAIEGVGPVGEVGSNLVVAVEDFWSGWSLSSCHLTSGCSARIATPPV